MVEAVCCRGNFFHEVSLKSILNIFLFSDFLILRFCCNLGFKLFFSSFVFSSFVCALSDFSFSHEFKSQTPRGF